MGKTSSMVWLINVLTDYSCTAQAGEEMLYHLLRPARITLSPAGKSHQKEMKSTRKLGCRPVGQLSELS